MRLCHNPLLSSYRRLRKAFVLLCLCALGLLSSTMLTGCVSLQSIPGMEELSFKQLLQKGFGDLSKYLAYYYPLTTTEFEVLQDPVLAAALQQGGAAVCVQEPCSPQAIPLQGYACQNAEQDFMLLELMTADLTLQRLYKLSQPDPTTQSYNLNSTSASGLQSDIAPQPLVALNTTTNTNTTTNNNLNRSSISSTNHNRKTSSPGEAVIADNNLPEVTLRMYGPVSVITNLPVHLPAAQL